MRTRGMGDGQLGTEPLTATTARLTRWAVAHYGRGVDVANVAPMPGHAGISFGFDVVNGASAERLVVRVAPPGLRREGPADVLRQVPVLRCARLHGVPVPDVLWWGDDEGWFGSPYFVVERLPGSSVNAWGPENIGPSTVEALFDQAISALAAIHRIDWRRRLPKWSSPRSLSEEVQAWAPVLDKGKNPEWTERALVLRDLLLRRLPPQPQPAVVHGDFYSNNWVCAGDRLLGIVDWEISAVGPPLLDLGWLIMMNDPESWGPTRRAWMDWSPAPIEIATAYAEASGRTPEDLGWYRALAAWRLASITALNVRLHRTGRRPDPVWEQIAESFDPMINRGCELLLSQQAAAL
jgi:aminoglycoside phosphotransferase (APT) family kinase protein